MNGRWKPMLLAGLLLLVGLALWATGHLIIR
jgi:hypothetical protein